MRYEDFFDQHGEIYATSHHEKDVPVIESLVDMRIVLKDVVVVLDKIDGKFSVIRRLK